MKPVFWMGGSRKDLKQFPDDVQDVVGQNLPAVQLGARPKDAKALKGFGGAGVLEIAEDFDGDAYRAVYTVKFVGAVYVLHCFQKKSKHGIATPQHELDLVRGRLKMAEEHYHKLKEVGRER
jgi:phage-related protein